MLPQLHSEGQIFEKLDSLLSHTGAPPRLSPLQEMQHISKLVRIFGGRPTVCFNFIILVFSKEKIALNLRRPLHQRLEVDDFFLHILQQIIAGACWKAAFKNVEHISNLESTFEASSYAGCFRL